MNEIENLITQAKRPTPSPELDGRIWQLTRPPFRASVIKKRIRRLALLTAGAGFVGFLLGRQSVTPTAHIDAVMRSPVSTESPAPRTSTADVTGTTSTRTVVELDASQAEALARFVTPPKRVEGLFGHGSLEDRTNSLQLE